MLNRAAGPSQSSGQSSHGERRPVRAPRPSQPQHDNELSQEPRDLAEGGIAHGIQATRFLILPAPHVKGPPIKAAMLRATPAHVHEPPQSPSPGPAAARGSLSPTAVPTVRMRVDPGVQPPLSVHTPLKVHTFDASAVSAPDGPDSWQWEPLHGNDPGGGIALLLPASALDGRYIGFGMNGYRLPPEEYGPRTWLAPEPIYEAGPMGRPRPRLVRPPRAAIDAYSGLDCKNPPATVLGIADLVDLICHSDKIVSLRDHGALSNPGTVIRPFGTFTGEFNAEAWRAIEMPEGLQVDLVEHQLVALRWVLDRDSGDGPDRELRGGILADDHGLGKTLVMIAMLLEQARCHPETFNKPTLIVCPLGLVDHWANEFATKVWPSRRFRVAVVKSAERPVYPEDVRDAQIIIAAYGSVARGMVQAAVSEFGRVILDDSHIMAGPETACARACCALVAPIRWCVTATPIMASPEDLFTQLRFIGYKPTRALWQFKEMATPSAVAPDADEDAIEQAKSEAASRLFKTMEHVMLRRVKSLSPFHRSVVVLPQQVDHSRLLGGYHSPRQAAYYRALAADGERLIATALQQAREDVEMSSMAPVMALLVRLRRPSTRPHLWMHPCEATNTGMSDEEMLEQARQLPSDVVRRLLTHTGSLPAHLSQGSEKDDCSTSDDDEAIMDRGLAASDGYSGRAGSITVEPGFRCIIGHEDVVNPLLGALCGHAVCDECFNRRADIVRGITGCPMCRAPLHDDRMFSYLAFRDVHVPADDDYEHRRLAGFVSQPSTAAPTVDEEVRDLEIAWDRIPIDWCEPERPRQHGET